MFRTWHVYDLSTGLFTGASIGADGEFSDAVPDWIVEQLPDGHHAITGVERSDAQKVDLATGQIIDHVPDQPSADHEWCEQTRKWVLKPETAKATANNRLALESIATLEAKQPRVLRELALGDSGALAKLKALDDEIAEHRKRLIK